MESRDLWGRIHIYSRGEWPLPPIPTGLDGERRSKHGTLGFQRTGNPLVSTQKMMLFTHFSPQKLSPFFSSPQGSLKAFKPVRKKEALSNYCSFSLLLMRKEEEEQHNEWGDLFLFLSFLVGERKLLFFLTF